MIHERLTFDFLDEIGFAYQKKNSFELSLSVDSLGPLVELVQLGNSGFFGSDWLGWLEPDIAKNFFQNNFYSSSGARRGFFKMDPSNDFNSFCLWAHRAALDCGFPSKTAAKFVAAVQELYGNVHDHSENIASGLIAFEATASQVDFVVSDLGIGILNSLKKNRLYSNLQDHGSAMQECIREKVSRYESGDHGNGFRPIFIGLANLSGSLRLRSGDSVFLLNGQIGNSMDAQLSDRPFFPGFLVSVSCAVN